MPKFDKLRETTFWVFLSQITPFHEQGVFWEEFQLFLTDFGTTHLLKSEIKAFPSEFKASHEELNKAQVTQKNKKMKNFILPAIKA